MTAPQGKASSAAQEGSGHARTAAPLSGRRDDPALYDRHGSGWWDADERFFRSLRSVDRFHLELLCEWSAGRLAGARVVDLGCGGGLLALPLAERGARVLGLDLSAPSLSAARAEARRRGLDASFLRADLRRAPLAAASADLVVLSDVLEHVERPAEALDEAARLLRPGGALFVNTFDRSRLASFFVVRLAEGLGLVPRGTHDPRLFVRPAELGALAERAGLELARLQFESAALLRTLATRTVHLRRSRRGFGYSAWLLRRG